MAIKFDRSSSLTRILSKLAKGFFEAPRAFSVDFTSESKKDL
jgi:hypothetical protein